MAVTAPRGRNASQAHPQSLRWPDKPLTDGTVVLDRMTPADIPAIADAIDREIVKWLPLPWPYTRDDAAEYLRWQRQLAIQGKALTFAIRPARDTRLVGAIALHVHRDAGSGEIGYWTAPHARRGGVASRATVVLAAYALTALALERVELLMHPANTASRRTAERAGARYVGIRGGGLERPGGQPPMDAAVYTLEEETNEARSRG